MKFLVVTEKSFRYQVYIACSQLNWLSYDDIFCDTIQLVIVSAHTSIKQVVNSNFESRTCKYTCFLSGDTVSADLLNFSIRAHDVRYKHNVSDIYCKPLLCEG